MAKTIRKKSSYSSTRKNFNSSSNSNKMNQFEKEITIKFLEMLMMVKLYHWRTTSYATHKATDELYSSLNEHIDKFIEVLLGKSGARTQLTDHKSIRLIDLNSQNDFEREMEAFKKYLVDLNHNKAMQLMSNTDLYKIRDEILGDINQLLYLLSFK